MTVAQVETRVAYHSDTERYTVYLRPNVTYGSDQSDVSSAQFSFVVPTGGFVVDDLMSISGLWSYSAGIVAPPEAPTFDYLVFNLSAATDQIPFDASVEVPLFSFANSGDCTGGLDFITEQDPFFPPNSQSINAFNQLSISGAGAGVNAWSGTYGGTASCLQQNSGCGVVLENVTFTSPSSCGLADGTIEVAASHESGFNLQYSLDGGSTWQPENIFTGLAAGDFFELHVRDAFGICFLEYGVIDLDAPLAANVTSFNVTASDCDADNGAINLTAQTGNNAPLQYSINGGAYQNTGDFPNLAPGSYVVRIQNLTSNCLLELNPAIVTEDCSGSGGGNGGGGNGGGNPVPDCLARYEIATTTDGRYEIALLPLETYADQGNMIPTAQITVTAPTGTLEVMDVQSPISGAIFAHNSTVIAPQEAPDTDYFSFGLSSVATTDIPFVTNERVVLFTFDNAADCSLDTLRLMPDDDPFMFPNSENVNVGQQLTVLGFGVADAPLCLEENTSFTLCPEADNGPDCVVDYELRKLPDGSFQVGLRSTVSYSGPDAVTSTAQVTIKVPTTPAGQTGFQVSNLTTIPQFVSFAETARHNAPVEDPDHDYISFGLQTLGTPGIPYEAGVFTPLFTFENGGSCTGLPVMLMDNETDPFAPPNSVSANAGQQLTVSGYGDEVLPVCVFTANTDDCPIFAPSTDTLVVSLPLDAPLEVCLNDLLDLPNGPGNGSICELPAELTIDFGATDECLTLSATQNFSGSTTACVIVCDETQTDICDTTILQICPQLLSPGTVSTCPGGAIVLNVEGGTGNFSWGPAIGLTCTDCPNPTASPTTGIVYSVSSTGENCSSTAELEVIIEAPILATSSSTEASNCGEATGVLTLVTDPAHAPYTYTLSQNDVDLTTDAALTGATIGDLAAGVYDLTLLGNSGCSESMSFEIETGATDLGIGVSVTATECGGATGTASIDNLPADAVVTWSDNLPDGGIQTNLAAGTVQATVTTPEGCTQTIDVTIEASGAPLATDLNTTDEICAGAGNGTLSFLPDGDYNYELLLDGSPFTSGNTQANTPVQLSELQPGNYELQLRLNADCDNAYPFEIAAATVLTANAEVDFPTNCDPAALSICVSAQGGVAPYQLNASQGTIDGECLTGLTAGTVDLTLTDANGCTWTATETVPVVEPVTIAAVDFEVSAPACPDSFDGSISSNGAAIELYFDELSLGFLPVQNLGVGTYELIRTNGICSDTLTLELEALDACVDCDLVLNDTLMTTAFNGAGTLCIPVSDDGTLIYQVNGQVVTAGAGECPNVEWVYAYQPLLDLGVGPYLLDWSAAGQSVSGVEFMNIDELIGHMNALYPDGNWYANTADRTIRGLPGSATPAALDVTHPATASQVSITLGELVGSYRQIAFETEAPEVELTVTDPATGCADTVLLLIEHDLYTTTPDTLYFTTLMDISVEDICLDLSELLGTTTQIGICQPAASGTIEVDDMECVDYTPASGFLGADQFCLVVCDELGICDTTYVFVTVEDRSITIFNGFSPNGDGVNDFFTVKNVEFYDNVEAIIFNRWGNLVYESDNYRNDFGGTWQAGGKSLPDGTYFYKIEIDGTIYSGALQIQR